MPCGHLIVLLFGFLLAQGQDIPEDTPKHVAEERNWFPYQVSILSNNASVCSGSIIDHRHLLTAAQCVTDGAGDRVQASTLVAVIGDLIIDGSSAESTGIRVSIREVVVHENFTRPNFANDIAILRIDALTFNENIRMVPMSNTSTPAGEFCKVAGWGAASYGGTHTRRLGYTYVNIVEEKKCEYHFANLFEPGMICGSADDKDVCDGDQGAALVCKEIQVGIVSLPQGCENTPSVYTNVTQFFTWIQTRLKQVSNNALKENHQEPISSNDMEENHQKPLPRNGSKNVKSLLILALNIPIIVLILNI